MTYDRIREDKSKNGNLLRKEISIPDSRSKIIMSIKKFPGALTNRVFSVIWCWRKEADGSFTLAFEDSGKSGSFSEGAAKKEADAILETDAGAVKSVRAWTRGFYRVVPLAPSVCKVTFVVQGGAGGLIPLLAINKQGKRTLSILKGLQVKYERNGRQVDAEVRSAYPTPPPLNELNPDQASVIKSCLELETDSDSGEGWTTLPSSFPFVDMWMTYTRAKKRHGTKERSVALGKARTIVDCSALTAAKWMFAYDSRVRMLLSAEKGNPARLVVGGRSPHDVVVATIKKFPFPLSGREFVARQLCVAEECTNDIIIAVTPADDTVDYGMNIRVVRGSTRACFRFSPINDTQCSVTLCQYFDTRGLIPVFIVNSLIPTVLGALRECRIEFERDDEIDAAERANLAHTMEHEPQDHTEDEKELHGRVQSMLGSLREEDFETMESPDPFVEMGHIFMKGDANIVGSACTVVDASMEECAAWDFQIGSRRRIQDFYKSKKGVLRQVVPVNDHCLVHHTIYNIGLGLTDRENYTKMVWKRLDENTIVTANDSCSPTAAFKHEEKGSVTARYTALLSYDRLPPIGNVAQTKVSLRVHANMGGLIPPAFVNTGGVNQMMHLSRMRMKFDRSAFIDAASRTKIVEAVKSHADEYSEEENRTVNESLSLFDRFNKEGDTNPVTSISPLCKNAISQIANERLAWGRSRVQVMATPEDVLAFQWDFLARHLTKADTIDKEVVGEINGHTKIIHMVQVIQNPIANRELVLQYLWKKLDKDTFVLIIKPVSHEKYPENESRRSFVPPLARSAHFSSKIRARFFAVVKLSRSKGGFTDVDYLLQLDLGGNDHGHLVKSFLRFYLIQQLRRTYALCQYFQALCGLEQWNEKDGNAVGEILMSETKEEKHRENGETKVGARMRGLFKKYKGLNEIGSKYGFVEGMLARVVQNKLRPAGNVWTKLCNVSMKEGRTMGSGLAMSLASNLTAEAAVDEWIGKYPSLRELDKAEVWFRPLINTVALRLLGEVPWGLKMRVFIGAGLSVLDMASDINVIYLYSNTPGQQVYGTSLLCMLILCLVMQLLVVYGQNKTRPKKLLREALIVLTGFKPGERHVLYLCISI
jgi:hypothetical protein